MAEVLAKPRVSVPDYLAFEREAEQRHELINGEIVDMSGGTFADSVISLNLGAELRAALRKRPCTVCSPDLRVKASNRYTYADVTVVCGSPVFDDRHRDTLLNPIALFEVLSDSTEAYDRGEKFAAYRSIASLEEYVLVSQKTVAVEHFHRQADGAWLLRTLGPGERLVLPALGCEIAVDEIYLKVFEGEIPHGEEVVRERS
ncbi:MAG TPA: Uma2 family endonuclease [Thermoanaerobaculia bacterium]|jgi:Uma2 family endonuclease|nr:Uma2 family endonuclease [Thermoanaerobaculia bacterium]